MASIVLALATFLALSQEDQRWLVEDSVPAVPVRHHLAEAINARGIAAFRQAALSEPGTNLILSPLGLSLSRKPGAQAQDMERLHAATLAHLRDTTREMFARIGAKAWGRKPDSQALAAWTWKTSGASLKSLDLSAGGLDSAGLVTQVFYLQGYWRSLRGQSVRGFQRPDGTVRQVTMLDFAETHVHVDSTRIVQLPFAEGRYSLVLVLPDSGRSLDGLIEGLAEEDWRIWMDLQPLIRVQGVFPALHIRQDGWISSPRPPIRYGNLLTIGNDPYKVQHPSIERVFKSLPFQTTPRHYEIRTPDPLPGIFFDRPFLFAVRDTRTGLLLMLGRVTDPSASPPGP